MKKAIVKSMLCILVGIMCSGTFLIIKAYHNKQEKENKKEQETVMQEMIKEEPFEIVIPKQNSQGSVMIKGVDRTTGETTIETEASGTIKIVNDGSNGEPIEIIVYAETAE